MTGFSWDHLAVWGVKLSTRPSQRAIHTRRASFVPRRLLDMVSNGDVGSIKIWDEKRHPNSRGTQTQRLLRRVPAHFTDHSHWFRVRGSLDHRLGTNATTRCTGNAQRGSQIRRWCCCPSNSARPSPEYATHESMHIRLPQHEPGSTEMYANSFVHDLNGHFADVVGICSGLTWRNKAFGHGTVRTPSGKAS